MHIWGRAGIAVTQARPERLLKRANMELYAAYLDEIENRKTKA